jgi:hypothetical protein
MIRRTTAAVLLGLVGALLLGSPAAAHPLGNFTTNQYAGLRVTAAGVDIDYVLDLAELRHRPERCLHAGRERRLRRPHLLRRGGGRGRDRGRPDCAADRLPG